MDEIQQIRFNTFRYRLDATVDGLTKAERSILPATVGKGKGVAEARETLASIRGQLRLATDIQKEVAKIFGPVPDAPNIPLIPTKEGK